MHPQLFFRWVALTIFLRGIHKFPHQLSFDHLAHSVTRKSSSKVHDFGDFVARHFVGAVGENLLAGQAASFSRYDDCQADLAPARIGLRNNGHFEYAGVRGDHSLNLGGVDILAARDEHILLASDDVIIAFAITTYQVASMPPAAAVGFRRGLGMLPIARAHMRTGQDQLTDFSRCNVTFLAIHNTCPRMKNGMSDGACLTRSIFGCQAKAVYAHLGQPVALTKFQAASGVSLDDRQWAGGTAGYAEAHAGEIGGCELRVLHHHLEDSGDSEDDGAVLALDGAQNRLWIRSTQQHDGTTEVIERRGQNIQSARVKEGCEGWGDIAIAQSPTDLCIDGVPGNHAVREHCPFGNAGSAGGVEDHRRLLAIHALERPGLRCQGCIRSWKITE